MIPFTKGMRVLTHSVMSDSLPPTRPLCHGIIPSRILEWVAISSSRGSSQPGIKSTPPAPAALAAGFFTTEPPTKALVSPCLLTITLNVSGLSFLIKRHRVARLI